MSRVDAIFSHSSACLAPSKGRFRCLAGLLCLASLTFGTPANAEECSDADKYPILADGWIAAQIECGKDALADALKDQAKAKLQELAKGLVATAVNYYLPGIGSMLFSSGSDPFAAHVNRILERIDQAEANIIQAIIDNHEREANLKITQLKNDLRLRADDELYIKVNDAAFYRQTLTELRLRVTDLTWHLGAPAGDLSLLTTKDLPKLHAIALLGALMVDLIPETAVLEHTSAWSRSTGRAFFDLTDADLRNIQEKAELQTVSEFEDLIKETIVPYLRALDNLDLFRKASDERFSKLEIPSQYPWGGIGFNGCPGFETVSYSVAGVGNYKHDWVSDGRCPQPQANEGSLDCREFYICENAYPGTLKTTTPLGTVSHRLPTRGEMVKFVQGAYDTEKDQQYYDYVRRTYGAVRPMLTSWGDLAPNTMPELSLDRDLQEAVLPALRFNPYYGMKETIDDGFIDAGNGIAWEDGQAEQSYRAFLGTVGDRQNFTTLDRRYLVDRVLAYGHTSVALMVIAPIWFDRLGPKYAMSIVRPILRVDTERDANDGTRSLALGAFYSGQFAAKYTSLM